MVSETTLISSPLKGSAAFINHSISFICSSLESVEGWNSLSIHFLASSVPANAGLPKARTVTAAAVASSLCFIDSSHLETLVYALRSPLTIKRKENESQGVVSDRSRYILQVRQAAVARFFPYPKHFEQKRT